MIKSIKTLKPGQPGTQKWKQQFGDPLLYVRYRYDDVKNRNLTTVEIVVDEAPLKKRTLRIPKNKIMHLKVLPQEVHVRKLIKSAGGRWNSTKQLWKLPYKDVEALGLNQRIVYDQR